jgi:hypothetical protein
MAFVKRPADFAGSVYQTTEKDGKTVRQELGRGLFWLNPAQDPAFKVLTGYIYVDGKKVRIEATQQ